MNMRTVQFLFCVGVGAAVGWLVGHVFGPHPGTAYDNTYQSRLDKALKEGLEVANGKTRELWREFDNKRRPA